MDDMTLRADVALTRRGLAPTRAQAQAMIRQGRVALNGRPVDKPSQPVSAQDQLSVSGEGPKYVSRGGLKLEKALASFACDPSGLVCLDVGASTGGFTDVLLRAGARHVYALDVGEGQLSPEIASDERVTQMDHQNARYLTGDMFALKPTLAVMDVSFISVTLILPALTRLLGPQGRVITLVKPQFEVGPKRVGKRGVVTSREAHADALRAVVECAQALGWAAAGLEYSPITGQTGNIEFLADLRPLTGETSAASDDLIKSTVDRAHRALRS